MAFLSTILALALALLAGMLACLELGRRVGRGPHAREAEKLPAGVAAAQGAVFALMGLLIAFSFSGAASRFEGRRDLVTEEANALRSAWRFLDLVPEPTRNEARASFRSYVDARLAAYAALPDVAAAMSELARAATFEQALWDRVTREAVDGSSPARTVLPALTSMFGVANKRTQTAQRHPPFVVFGLLFLLALACAFLAGFAMSPATRRPLGHMLAFAIVISATVYVVLDLEYPRMGLIRVDASDQVLFDLRATMGD